MARRIEDGLPAGACAILSQATEIAHCNKERLYLVGGAVRDLLLEKPVFDIDLVLEGNAIALAEALGRKNKAAITLHRTFLTASLAWPHFSIDVTTARCETYARPGALPDVHNGTLRDDLFRRDFSINSMAVSLAHEDYGRLIDYYGGLADLHNGLVRVLHERSFEDDATRIWRAVRYEQRLGFHIEEKTLALLRHSLPMLETISGDRIWYELECVFRETLPEKVLARAAELGVLRQLHLGLSIDKRTAERFEKARCLNKAIKASAGLYMALLACDMNETAGAELADYLNLKRTLKKILRDSRKIKALHEELSEDPLQPSAIYLHLNGFSEDALKANLIASESQAVRRNILLYLDELRYVKTSLKGDDLLALGIQEGPLVKLLLGLLLEARLDGEVASREDEIKLLKQFT